MTEKSDEIKPNQPEPDIHPWLGVLVRPRSTLEQLLRRETPQSARTLWLSFTALVIAFLFLGATFYPGDLDRAALRMRLVFATPFIFALSYLYFVVESYLLHKVGEWFGGRSTPAAMRVINAYTTVIPGVILGPLNILVAVLLDKDSLVRGTLENIILGWTVYITAVGIGVAAGINPWRGLAVYIVTLLFWLALGLLAGTLLFGQLPTAF
ncbi:MAG: Yip1 family protein [Negativicutes bacterium]|nr:Yip1 family protein [Negativicutes bacterium]